MSLKERLFGSDEKTATLPCSPSEAFDALANSRRRHILDGLYDAGIGEPIDVGELATTVAFIESDVRHEDLIDSQQRKAVYVAIYQTHVPKLASYGLVEADTGRPSEAALATDITPLIEAMRDIETATGGA